MMRTKLSRAPAIFAALAIFAATALALALAGCDNSASPGGGGTPTFTVSFTSTSGTVVAPQSVTEGGFATKPTPTRPWTVPAGLWLSADFAAASAAEYSVAEWRQPDGTPWVFATDAVTANITLAAHWAAPTVTVTPALAFTIIADAMTHVNNNTGPFTLAIDDDVTATATLSLSSASADLTIVGIGGEREITRTGTGRLFNVAVSEARLTIGNNITLVGRDGNTNDLVIVQNGGHLTMLDGSRITGHTSSAAGMATGLGAAVNVGNNGTFTMSGGTITGNTGTGTATWISGGVFVNADAGGRFYMEGGSITGNTRGAGIPADIYLNNAVSYLRLSGTAAIGHLTLNALLGGVNASIAVGPNWTGSVSNLSLRHGVNYIDAVISYWTDRTVLQAAGGHTLTAADVGRLNLNTARFIGNNEDVTQPVSQTHSIALEDVDTVGRLRANP